MLERGLTGKAVEDALAQLARLRAKTLPAQSNSDVTALLARLRAELQPHYTSVAQQNGFASCNTYAGQSTKLFSEWPGRDAE